MLLPKFTVSSNSLVYGLMCLINRILIFLSIKLAPLKFFLIFFFF